MYKLKNQIVLLLTETV